MTKMRPRETRARSSNFGHSYVRCISFRCIPTEWPSRSDKYVVTRKTRIAEVDVAKNAPPTKQTKQVLIQSDMPVAQMTRPCTASPSEPSTLNTDGRTAPCLTPQFSSGADLCDLALYLRPSAATACY